MMNVKVKIYDVCKYNKDSKKVAEVEYNDIKKRLPNQEYILGIEKGPWE